MNQARPNRFWRRLRAAFRVCRIFLWTLLLTALLALLYFNRVGLPDFLKRPLLDELRGRGVDLEFSRLRLSFGNGLVAENVRFASAEQRRGPDFTVEKVRLALDWHAFLARKLRVNGLVLTDGRLRWPLAETNRAPRSLSVEHLRSELYFQTNDVWVLNEFQAEFAGTKVRLAGTITNATAWHAGRTASSQPVTNVLARIESQVRILADVLEQIQFPAPPELQVNVRGDLRDATHGEAHLRLIAVGAESPWGSFTNGLINAEWLPADTNGQRHAVISLQADTARTPWGSFTDGLMSAHLFPADTNGQRRAEVSLVADTLRTPWFETRSPNLQLTLQDVEQRTNLVTAVLDLHAASAKIEGEQSGPLEFKARWRHAFTNYVPVSGNGELRAQNVETRWGKAARAVVNVELAPGEASRPAAADASWGAWRFIEPYTLGAEVALDQVESQKLNLDQVALTAKWRAPVLELARLETRLYGGTLKGSGSVNAASRAVRVEVVSDFDIQQITPMLAPQGAEWIRRYGWEEPPHAQGEVAATLPAWTNRAPDWRELLPTLWLNGQFRVGRGSFRGISASSAESHVSYSNMIWNLPDLVVTRPEGRLDLVHVADDRARSYYFKLRSTLDPNVLRSQLQPELQRSFDLVQFTEMPLLEGEFWGRWRQPESVGFAGSVAATNFTFRAETGLVVRATVQYTNRVLTALAPEVWQGGGSARVDGLRLDLPADSLFLTNGTSNLDPMVIARAIGPKTARVFEPYRFASPPRATANGVIPLHTNLALANLAVHLDGGPFEWWKIKTPQINGWILWRGNSLSLSNVNLSLYEGAAAGRADFDLRGDDGTRMGFDLATSDVNLRKLMADFNPARTNLQGLLSGRLVITDAVGTNWQTWNGYGDVALREGTLWEVPLFGEVFSTVLNVVALGADLGTGRAGEATATFNLTNGIAHTRDMEIHEKLMRLSLRGAFTLDGQVDARVEAALLHETPGIGPMISRLLWPLTKVFEYKVTGTLHKPVVEPQHGVTRLFLMPFHPFQTLRGLFGVPDQPPSIFPSPVENPAPAPAEQ